MLFIMNPFQNNRTSGNSLLDNVEFINAINIVSFFLAIQNLQLNVTANDLDNYANKILEEIHGHLKEQDKHLSKQDSHLREQDYRIERLERLVLENSKLQKGEHNHG